MAIDTLPSPCYKSARAAPEYAYANVEVTCYMTKKLQPITVLACLCAGLVLGIFLDHATVKAQAQPAEPSVGAWEIYTGNWTAGTGNAGGYYVIKLNRITGEALVLDRQDNKSSINPENAHWLRLDEAKLAKK